MNLTVVKIISCLLTVVVMIALAKATTSNGSLLSIVISFLIIFLTSLGLISTPRWKDTHYAAARWGMFIGSVINLAIGLILLLSIIRLAPLAS